MSANENGKYDELACLIGDGISQEMLIAGMQRIEDQCGVYGGTAASIAREVFLAMRQKVCRYE